MKRYKNIILGFLVASFTLVACEDMFDVDPEEVVLSEDFLGADEYDARASLFGVLSLMQDANEQYFVWGEMRGDLVDVTDETEDELRQIAYHENSEDNSYLDATLLFSIVNNCNYGLAGIDTAYNENDLLDEYVSLLRVRTWAQLQIAINFGQLPYFTEPIESTEDITKEYPLLTLSQAMDSLINVLLPYNGVESISSDDYTSSESSSPAFMIPEQNVLLGDLYLWNQEYENAATYYKAYLDEKVTSYSSAYNLTDSYGVTYTTTGYTSNWVNVYTSRTAETIFYTGYSDDYNQGNNLYDNLYGQVIASEAIDIKWSVQERLLDDVVVGYGDGRESTIFPFDENSYGKLNEDFYKYDRVSRVYLRYAEAINNAGYPAHALFVVNSGLYNEDSDYPSFSDNTAEFLNFDSETYYSLTSTGLISDGNLGIRGRVNLEAVEIEDAATLSDSIAQVDALILEEEALELAFEGTRWTDLVRSALRNNDASIVADAIAAKFIAYGDASTAAELGVSLLNSDNWYLPLTIPDNFISVEQEEE